ncbi:MAG: rhomboid family intramembrane serine protease [Aggregatilineales bacterium]
MIPYRVTGGAKERPYITFMIMMIMIGFFLWEMSLTIQSGQPIEDLINGYTLVTCEVGQVAFGETMLDGVRSLFLHESFFLFMTNILFMWVFAPLIEEFLGGKRFLFAFLLAGFGGHLLSILFNSGECMSLIGPSGAISGMLGMFLVLYPYKRIVTGVPLLYSRSFELPAFVYVIVYFLMSIFAGEGGPLSGTVAPFWDEVGGFIVGLAIIFVATMFKAAPKVELFED